MRLPAFRLRVGMKNRIIAIPIATVASSIRSAWGSSRDHPGMVSKPSTRSFRKTQPKAVAAKTASTARSSNDMPPSAAYSRFTTSRSTSNDSPKRKNTRVRSSHTMVSRTRVMGNAITNHWPKAMGSAFGNVISKILANDRFGGVPTSVAMPPSEQA